MSEQKQVISNSRIMMLVTLISRLFGLARDQLVAWLFGTTRSGDVWVVAFMIPNLFRRLIAEGAMATAFIPILSELTEKEKEQAARDFMKTVFTLILMCSVLIVTIMVLVLPVVLPVLVRIMNPLSVVRAEGLDGMVLPTQLMFPYLIFISLAAICQGVLNVNNRFALSAATPIVLNCCIIAFGLALKDWHGDPIWGLCAGVLVGGSLQFLVQWWWLFHLGFRLTPVMRFWGGRTREAVRLWLPTVFSGGVIQINILVGTLVAANISAGAATAIQYANRVMELILGVFTAAISTSILPVLARQFARNDKAAMNESLWSGLALMTLVALPASAGLLTAGPSVIHYLFRRGAFDDRSVILTFASLIFYALALLPISWYRILVQTFYAAKRIKLVVVIATMAAAVNMAGCFLLPALFDPAMRLCGVPLATLISSWVLAIVALSQLRRKFALVWPAWFRLELVKIALATIAFIPLWLPFDGRILSFPFLLLKVSLSVLIFLLLVGFMKVESFMRLVRKKSS